MQGTFKRFYHPTLTRMSFLDKFLKPMMATASPKEYQIKQLVKPIGLTQAPRKSTKYSQGKLFIAPVSYWKEDKALFFPHLIGTAMDGTKQQNIEDMLRGKTSIVRLFSTASGDKLSSSYFQGIVDDNKKTDYLTEADARLSLNDSNVQIIEVNLVENAVKSALVKTLARWANRVPSWRQPFYFECSRGQWPFSVRDELFCNNVFSGYVFLVDQQLKIRWAACGEATPSEKEALWKFAKRL